MTVGGSSAQNFARPVVSDPLHVDTTEMSQLESSDSEAESMEQPGVQTRSKVKRSEARLQRQRDNALQKCKSLEQEMEMLKKRLSDLEVAKFPEDTDGEQSTQSSEYEKEELEPRRRGSSNGSTIQDWFDEFDALATVYEWSSQEKLHLWSIVRRQTRKSNRSAS